ncbi:MAG TPA: T9SS type A sorting domain-containing protein [Flavobacteriales bacterium]|nr:T9SS type A sorting domain-containing protein [Flavobacteriales bacterium]
MIKKLLTIILGALTLTVNGQNVTFEWAKSMGGSSFDSGVSITTDASGNVYTTGFFYATVDFDPGVGTLSLTPSGGADIYIQKLDANGTLLWAKSMGGTGDDYGMSITTDALGNVYTTGNFRDTVDFDPGVGVLNLTSAGLYDMFIQKLDPNGNLLWAKSLGGSGFDQGVSITTDALGNVYTTGDFDTIVDFDPGVGTLNLTSAGVSDIFIQKLDANGNLIWAKSMGGTSEDFGHAITTDALGNVYTTGWFSAIVDFDPGTGTLNLTTAGIYDIFIQKLDANGNLIWAKSMGGTGDDYGTSITVDALGNVYTTGYFETIVDFDPGVGTLNLTSAGASDIFIQKLDSNGNFLWANTMGGSSADQGISIIADASGNVYATGSFRDTVDFDPDTSTLNLISAGASDIFIQKLDPNGNLTWVKSMGGTLLDAGSSTIDTLGNVYTTGYFDTIVDFDPGTDTLNLTSVGQFDIFIQKLSQCFSSYSTDTQTACDSYTWIDGNTYTSSNSTATDTLTNAAGCDSVVTLNLTINTVESSVTQNGTILSSNQSGASYQWVECPAMTPISGATSQSYIATSNGDFAVIVNYNGCVDTSACYTVSIVAIIANDFGNRLLIYPNPSDGDFTIDLGNTNESIIVKSTDLNGKLIETNYYKTTQLLHLKIEEPAGVYLLIIESGDKKAIIRLVKE